MPESSEAVTIRRLPGGEARPARIAKSSSDRLAVLPAGSEGEGFEAGVLVEIEGPHILYLGEIVERQPDSQLIIAVEHVVDLAALAEIEKTWNGTPD